ncbi:hypothetical protein D5086_009116 [Populus alba]|uniref:Uncharacterized protein n=1 Tax=Populus alba TaxID=43335 RepID=A0ACC4CHD5_POPAL
MLPPSKEKLLYHLNIDNFSTEQTANPQFWHKLINLQRSKTSSLQGDRMSEHPVIVKKSDHGSPRARRDLTFDKGISSTL